MPQENVVKEYPSGKKIQYVGKTEIVIMGIAAQEKRDSLFVNLCCKKVKVVRYHKAVHDTFGLGNVLVHMD